jgi:fucose permease
MAVTGDVVPASRLRALAVASAAVYLLNGTVISAWLSRIPATRDRLDLDTRGLGVVLLMAGIGSLVAMPFVGHVASRVGSRRVEVVTAIVTGVALVLLAVTPNAVTTGAVLFVLGAAYGSWDVAINVQGSFVDRTAGRDYMPRYHACWSVGAVTGAALGALAAAVGVPLLVHFSVAALLAVVLTIVVVSRWWIDDREEHSEQVPESDGVVRRRRLLTRRLALIGLITLCGTLLEGSASDWVALYLRDDRAQVEAVAALGYATFAIAMASTRFAGTAVIERVGRTRAVRAAGLLATVGVAAALTLPGLVGVLIGVLLWGAGTALVFPAAMSAGGEQPGRAADGIAAVSTIGYGGFLIGPPLIGLLAHGLGLGRALWVLAPLGVAIALLSPVVASPRTAADATR